MAKCKLFLTMALITAVFALSSCNGVVNEASGTVYEKIQNKLINMESFQSEAEVKYISNTNEHSYKTFQQARMSGEYRIEVTGPENVAGNITLSDGKIVCQFNTRVTGKISVGTAETQDRTEILLTSFVKNYVRSKEVSVSVAKIAESECTVLEAKIPGDHPYLASEKLWVDNKSMNPVQLIIYDPQGTERIVVTFSNFEYNVNLADNLFKIE